MTTEMANRREQILFGQQYDKENYSMGGVRYFDKLSYNKAKTLMEQGFVDPEECQNCSPSASEMLEFCSDDPEKWYLHGYAVSPERDDCRITFEGIGSTVPIDIEDAFAFMKMFRYADDLCAEPGECAYCWYD